MTSPRILLIDRNTGWLKFAEETLRQAGYAVETASDFAKASLRCPEGNFDLIFVGLDQVESHLGTLTDLAKNPSRPWRFVVMFPVRQTFDRVRIVLKAGAYDVVDKPYQRDALLSTVAAVVHEARLRNHVADAVRLSKVRPV
jgi:DNA-binding NtrC family response regulator